MNLNEKVLLTVCPLGLVHRRSRSSVPKPLEFSERASTPYFHVEALRSCDRLAPVGARRALCCRACRTMGGASEARDAKRPPLVPCTGALPRASSHAPRVPVRQSPLYPPASHFCRPLRAPYATSCPSNAPTYPRTNTGTFFDDTAHVLILDAGKTASSTCYLAYAPTLSTRRQTQCPPTPSLAYFGYPHHRPQAKLFSAIWPTIAAPARHAESLMAACPACRRIDRGVRPISTVVIRAGGEDTTLRMRTSKPRWFRDTSQVSRS